MACASDLSVPRLSLMGTSALLLDAPGDFDLTQQQRIWALDDVVKTWPDVGETVVGVTNLLLIWRKPPSDLQGVMTLLRQTWQGITPKNLSGSIIEVPVTYGGERAIDFEAVLQHTGLSADELIRIHSSATYTVCAIGAAPGFGYLHGLDPRLACPRKATPAMSVLSGSVTIGGFQTGVSSMTGPNGWNVIGYSDVQLFDFNRCPASLLAPGDQVRFVPRTDAT